jgi:hypothetical protein
MGSKVLQLLVRWVTGDQSAIPFSTCKRDYPRETADYLLRHKVGSSNGRHTSGRYTPWARQFSRKYSPILRRLIRLLERGTFGFQARMGRRGICMYRLLYLTALALFDELFCRLTSRPRVSIRSVNLVELVVNSRSSMASRFLEA